MLSFTEYLTETQGLIGRKPGEPFIDKDGKILLFQTVKFFDNPKDAGNISDATAVNKPMSNLTGVAVASFKAESGKIVRFIKYIKPKTTKWDNSTPNYFEFKSKAAIKEKSGLKPTDFLKKEKMTNLSMKDILDQVGKAFGEVSPLYTATKQAIAGRPISVVIGDLSENGITNYFAEILHPIALMTGQYEGNAKDGIVAITGTDDISKFKINFPQGSSQGLYDSYLTSGDLRINISSKYGSASKAAKASVTNLYNIYKAYKDKEMFEEFGTAIELARIIAESGAETAPLEIASLLAKKGFLKFTEEDKQLVEDLKTNPNVKLTKNIIKLRDNINAYKPSSPFTHVIAGIAKSVSAVINQSQDIQFSRFACLLLNGTVIQMYTRTKKPMNGIIEFNKFKAQWPDDSVTNVLLESTTRYKTDRIDGKFGYEVRSK